MSLIQEFRDTENAIKELEQRLANLQNDDRLAKELEFSDKLKALMNTYGKNLRDIINIIDPQAAPKAAGGSKSTRSPRQAKTFKNPHTGDTVITKGGNHAVLKAWKAEYGADEVAGWQV